MVIFQECQIYVIPEIFTRCFLECVISAVWTPENNTSIPQKNNSKIM